MSASTQNPGKFARLKEPWFIRDGELPVSVSMAQTWLRCPRLFWYTYVLRKEPIDADTAPQDFGTAGHAALASWWYEQDDSTERLQRALEAARATDAWGRLSRAAQLKLRAVLTAYHSKYKRQSWEILEIEEKHKLLLHEARGIWLRLTPDAIARNRETGETWVVEHKFTSADITPGSYYWDLKDIDLQNGVYTLAARAMGYDVEGVLYDVAKRPGYRLRKATPKRKRQFYKRDGKYGKAGDPKPGTYLEDESENDFLDRVVDQIVQQPSAFLQRREYRLLEGDVEAAAEDIIGAARLIQGAGKAGLYPRNQSGCKAFNRTCEFYPVCASQASLDDPGIYQTRPRRRK